MTEEATVTVVVPVRNGAATIEACIGSLLLLDWPDGRLELLIVDNASTDQTRQVLGRFEGRVRVVREPKPGPAAARNAGVRSARGEWIAFTDADCVVEPGWLRHLLPPLANPGVGIAGGRVVARPPRNRIQQFGEKIHDQRRAIEEFNPPYVATANWASRRSVLEEVGLFDDRLLRGSDADLALRIGARGYRLVYRHDAVVSHPHESTLQGLFNEGSDHGRGSEMMRRARGQVTFLASLRSRGRAIARSAIRVVTGPERFDALCMMIFDAGKTTGKLREHLTVTWSRRHP